MTTGKSAPPSRPFRGLPVLRFLTPNPETLFFAAPADVFVIVSIVVGATALMILDNTPFPFLVRFGLTTPKPVTLVIPFKTSPITPFPFFGRPLFGLTTPSPSIGFIMSSILFFV